MHNNRLQKLKKLLHTKRLPALFVTSPQNVTYLSGFRGHESSDVLVPCLTDSEVTLLIIADDMHLPRRMTGYAIADGRTIAAIKNVSGFIPIRLEKNIAKTLQKLLRHSRCSTLGVEHEALRVSDLTILKKKIRGAVFRDASRLVPELRRIKDRKEIAALTKACGVTDSAFAAIFKIVRPGMTEGEVAHFLIDFFSHHADGPSFAPIVASGKGAAIPHYHTSKTKKIRKGEMLLLDFGAQVDGYHADMTRTIFIGKATTRFRKVYALVLEAQKRVLARLSTPGVDSRAADEEVRKTFRGAGVEKHFLHSTGHGVGLQIHEAPRLSPRSTDLLQENDVFTVEPGLYFPSWGGVRIEDTVVMTKNGAHILTHATKKLLAV